MAEAPAGPATRPPAFLNLCVTRGKLDGAAYAATILGLGGRPAARSTEPGGRAAALRAAARAAGDPGLAGSSGGPGHRDRPGEADGPRHSGRRRCTADVPGTWTRSSRAVRRAGPGSAGPDPSPRLLARGARGLLYVRRRRRLLRSWPSRPGRTAACGRPDRGLPSPSCCRRTGSGRRPAGWLTGSGALAAWSAAAVPEWTAAAGPDACATLPEHRREHGGNTAGTRRCAAARECGGPPRDSGGGARTAAGGRHSGPRARRKQARRRAGRGQGGISWFFQTASPPRAAWSSRRGSGGWWTCPPPAAAAEQPGGPGAAAAWPALLCYLCFAAAGIGLRSRATVLPPLRSPPGGRVLALARWWPSPPRRPSTARSSPAGSSGAAAGTMTSTSPASRWTMGSGPGARIPAAARSAGCRWGTRSGSGPSRSRKLLGLDTPGAAPSGPACEAPPAVTDPVPPPGAAGAGTGLPSGSLLLTPGEAVGDAGRPGTGDPVCTPVRCWGDLPARWRDGDRDGGRRPARRGQCRPGPARGPPAGGSRRRGMAAES